MYGGRTPVLVSLVPRPTLAVADGYTSPLREKWVWIQPNKSQFRANSDVIGVRLIMGSKKGGASPPYCQTQRGSKTRYGSQQPGSSST